MGHSVPANTTTTTLSFRSASDTFLPPARGSGSEKSATFLPGAGADFSPLTTQGAAGRARQTARTRSAIRRLNIANLLLLSRESQPGHRLDRERHLLLVARHGHFDRGAGLDVARRSIQVGDAVGPAAVERQQAVAGLQARCGRGAAGPDFLERHSRL